MLAALLLCAVAVAALPVGAWAQAASADGATSATAEKRVRLRPILKPSEGAVRLKPVLKRKSKPKAKPVEQTEAEEAPEAAPAATRDQEAPNPVTAVQPPDSKPGASRVKQPPLPAPLKPGEKPAHSAASVRASHRLAAAQGLLEDGEIDQGRELLFQLATEIPGTKEAAQALLAAALALDDVDQSKAELREIVRAYPNGEVSRIALARMGELNFIVGNYEESIHAYRNLRKIAENKEQRRDADFKIAVGLLRSEKFAEAQQALLDAARDYPELKDSPEFIEARGDASMAIGQWGEANAFYDTLQRSFPNYESTAKVLMNRGLCSELLGSTDTARQNYAQIIKEFPGTTEAGLAQQRLDDLSSPLVAEAGV